jgi:hypothetical protein
MKLGAIFSPNRQYRYRLTRTWGNGPSLIFLLHNPSTADERKDDPTITRCMGRASNEGYGGVVILNLFAMRATDPKDLLYVEDAIGPENDAYLHNELSNAHRIVCAWGNLHKKLATRENQVLTLIGARQLYCLKINESSGSPGHPLYLAMNLKIKPWERRV